MMRSNIKENDFQMQNSLDIQDLAFSILSALTVGDMNSLKKIDKMSFLMGIICNESVQIDADIRYFLMHVLKGRDLILEFNINDHRDAYKNKDFLN
jgi:hypothetical protein